MTALGELTLRAQLVTQGKEGQDRLDDYLVFFLATTHNQVISVGSISRTPNQRSRKRWQATLATSTACILRAVSFRFNCQHYAGQVTKLSNKLAPQEQQRTLSHSLRDMV